MSCSHPVPPGVFPSCTAPCDARPRLLAQLTAADALRRTAFDVLVLSGAGTPLVSVPCGLLAAPAVEHVLHVLTLRDRERRPGKQAANLVRVVVHDRGFEMLATGQRLPQLPSQPAQQADTKLIHVGVSTLAAAAPLVSRGRT